MDIETHAEIDAEILAARASSEEMLVRLPRVVAAWYDAANNRIHIELNKGFSISFPPQRAQTLAAASPDQLSEIEFTYPGFELYFPRLDDGLWVPSLVTGRFGNDRWEADWAAKHDMDRAA